MYLTACLAVVTGKVAGCLDDELGVRGDTSAFITITGQKQDCFFQQQPVYRMLIAYLSLSCAADLAGVMRELPCIRTPGIPDNGVGLVG